MATPKLAAGVTMAGWGMNVIISRNANASEHWHHLILSARVMVSVLLKTAANVNRAGAAQSASHMSGSAADLQEASHATATVSVLMMIVVSALKAIAVSIARTSLPEHVSG